MRGQAIDHHPQPGRLTTVRRVDGVNSTQRIGRLIEFQDNELTALDLLRDDEVQLVDQPLAAHGGGQLGVTIVGSEIAADGNAHTAMCAERPLLAADLGR